MANRQRLKVERHDHSPPNGHLHDHPCHHYDHIIFALSHSSSPPLTFDITLLTLSSSFWPYSSSSSSSTSRSSSSSSSSSSLSPPVTRVPCPSSSSLHCRPRSRKTGQAAAPRARRSGGAGSACHDNVYDDHVHGDDDEGEDVEDGGDGN